MLWEKGGMEVSLFSCGRITMYCSQLKNSGMWLRYRAWEGKGENNGGGREKLVNQCPTVFLGDVVFVQFLGALASQATSQR